MKKIKINRLTILFFIMLIVVMAFAVSLSLILYRYNIEEHKTMLTNMLTNRENLIKTVFKFEKKRDGIDFNYRKTRNNIIKLLSKAKGGRAESTISGEIVLAEKRDDKIYFLIEHRFTKGAKNNVPFGSDTAVPMQLALKKKSGTVIAPDYRDQKVLAAYRYVKCIDAGIVVKQDLSEIKINFMLAIFASSVIGIIFIIAGSIIFLKVGDRLTIDLKTAYNQLETVFNTSLDAKWLIDLDYNIKKVNDTFLKMFSLNKDEVIGKKCYEVLRSKYCGTKDCRCRKIKNSADEKDLHAEGRKISSSSGIDILTQSYASPIYDNEGKVNGIFESFIDETKRKEYEQKIRYESELQKRLNEFSLSLQEKPNLKDVSQSTITFLCKQFGAKVGNFYVLENVDENKFKFSGGFATNINENVKYVYPGKTLIGQAVKGKERVMFNELPDNYISIGSSLGNIKPKYLLIQPFIYNNEVNSVCEIASMSEFNRKQLNFLNRITEIIATAVNNAMAKNKIEKLLDETRRQAEELQTNNEEMETQQEELRAANEDMEKKTKKLKESETKLLKHQDKLRQINEELNNSKKQLEQQKLELEKTSNYKSEFLANMSHELRTPLNSLLILSNRFKENREGNLTEKQVHNASIIYKQGRELLELINDILDISKIEAGRMSLNMGKVRLRNFEDEIEDSFSQLAQEKGLEFTVNITPDVPEYINTDRQKLDRIIKNLISNAVKFTSEGKININIYKPKREVDLSESGLSAKNTVAFSVKDTGAGIPNDKIDTIFDAFEQADSSTSRKFGGTGLGLSISKKLADMLGGEIHVISKEGEGSIFTFFLGTEGKPDKDLSGCSDVKKIEENTDVLKDDRNNCRQADKSLLIIEDNENDDSIYKICRNYNIKILHSSNGEEALEIAEKYKPDVILLDMIKPPEQLEGLEIYKKLKQKDSIQDIPIYMIGHYDTEKENLIRYVQKPVSREKIEKILEDISGNISHEDKSILIVEDNPIEREELEEIITEKGFSVETAENGKDALDLIEKNKFDIVILDIILPDFSGFDILKTIGSKIPVIINTGKDLTEKEQHDLYCKGAVVVMKEGASHERIINEVKQVIDNITSEQSEEERKVKQGSIAAGGNESEHIDKKEVSENVAGKKVLLVEDDMKNLYAVEEELNYAGLEIVKATNGKLALETLEKDNSIDIIVMDIMMPVMDGYEAIKAIRRRKEWNRIPIIAMTAKAMKGDRKKCIETGADEYLSKPVETKELLTVISKCLEK